MSSSAKKKKPVPKLLGGKQMVKINLVHVRESDFPQIRKKKKTNPQQKTLTIRGQGGVPLLCLEEAAEDSPEPHDKQALLYFKWSVAYEDGTHKPFIPSGRERKALKIFARKDPQARRRNWTRFSDLAMEATGSLYFPSEDNVWNQEAHYHSILSGAGDDDDDANDARTDGLGAVTGGVSATGTHALSGLPVARTGGGSAAGTYPPLSAFEGARMDGGSAAGTYPPLSAFQGARMDGGSAAGTYPPLSGLPVARMDGGSTAGTYPPLGALPVAGAAAAGGRGATHSAPMEDFDYNASVAGYGAGGTDILGAGGEEGPGAAGPGTDGLVAARPGAGGQAGLGAGGQAGRVASIDDLLRVGASFQASMSQMGQQQAQQAEQQAETNRLQKQGATLQVQTDKLLQNHIRSSNKRHDASDAKHLASEKRHDHSDAKHLESAKKQKKTDADIEQLRQESARKEKKTDADIEQLRQESARKEKKTDADIEQLRQESARKEKTIDQLSEEMESLKSSIKSQLFGDDNSSTSSMSTTRSLFSKTGSGAPPPPLSAGGSGRLPTKMSSIRSRSVPKTTSPIPEHAAVAPKPFALKNWQPEDYDSEGDSEDDSEEFADSINEKKMGCCTEDKDSRIPKEIAIKTGAPGSLPPTPLSQKKIAAVDNRSNSRAGALSGLSLFGFGSFFSRGSGAPKANDENDDYNNESGTAAALATHNSLGSPERKYTAPPLRSSLKKKKKNGGSCSSAGSVSFKQQVEVQPFSLAIAANPANSNGLPTALDKPYGSPYSESLRDPLHHYEMPEARREVDSYHSLYSHSGLSHQEIEDQMMALEAQELEEQKQLEEASDDGDSTDSEDQNKTTNNHDALHPAALHGESSQDALVESPPKRRLSRRTSVGPQQSAPSKRLRTNEH